MFVIGYEGKSGFVIVPIDAFINLDITNLRPIRTTIEKYELQTAAKKEGPWINLCWLPFGSKNGERLYARGSPGLTLYEWSADANILDDSVLERELIPGDTVRGFTAWACPSESVGCAGSFFRMKIEEASGLVALTSVVSQSSLSKGASRGPSLRFTGSRIDLSNRKYEIERDRCH
jgi:hypothetical protein